MNIKNLKCFIAIAEESSITRAAERLYITQPALSRTLKEMEDELGCQLFNREKKNFTLNENGKVLLKHARIVVQDMDNLMLAVKKQKQQSERSELAIGTFNSYLMDAFLPCFLRSHQNFRCSITEYPDAQCAARLNDGDCDVFITHTEQTGDFLKYTLFHDRIYVSMPFGMRHYDAQSLTMEELYDLPFFASDRSRCPTDPWTHDIMEQHKDHFRDLLTVNLETAQAYGHSNERCVLITGAYLVYRPLEAGRVLVPLDAPNCDRYISLCYKKENAEKVQPLIDCIDQNRKKLFSHKTANVLPDAYSLLY